MGEWDLIEYAAPTLAGLKTGSLFGCLYEDAAEITSSIRELNQRLRSSGMRLIPLKMTGKRALVYLYRPDRLRQDLAEPAAGEILREAGYEGVRAPEILRELIGRLGQTGEFPHEIGLFLSYPPEDVRGFIEHKGRNPKFKGDWLVYGDEKAAAETFRRYKKCTDCYRRMRQMGQPIERLAVACQS